MPHVVINGEIKISTVFEQLEPFFINNESGLLKIRNSFMSINNKEILLDTLCVDSRTKNQFFILINQRNDGLVVRIYPIFEVEKTPCVKNAIAQVAKKIIDINDSLRIGKTNLSEFLD